MRSTPDRTVLPGDVGHSLILVHKRRVRSSGALDGLRTEWSPVFVSDDGVMVVLAHESVTTTEAGGPAPG